MNTIAISLLAAANNVFTDEQRLILTSLKEDDITRPSLSEDGNTFFISVDDVPCADKKWEITKIWTYADDKFVNHMVQVQAGTPFNEVTQRGLNNIFSLISTNSDTGEVESSDWASGAIGYTDEFRTEVWNLMNKLKDKTFKSFRSVAVRDFQMNRSVGALALLGVDGSMMLIGVDGSKKTTGKPQAYYDAVLENRSIALFEDANYDHKLGPNTHLLRTPRNQDDIYAMVWDGDSKMQIAYNDKFEIVAAGKVKGPVMPTIDETKIGLVNAVIPTASAERKVLKFAKPSAVIDDAQLQLRYAS